MTSCFNCTRSEEICISIDKKPTCVTENFVKISENINKCDYCFKSSLKCMSREYQHPINENFVIEYGCLVNGKFEKIDKKVNEKPEDNQLVKVLCPIAGLLFIIVFVGIVWFFKNKKKKSKKNSINKRTGSDFVKITINDDCLNECTKSLSHHDSANASIPSAVENFSTSNPSINLQNQVPAEEQNNIEIEAESRDILEMIAQITQEEKDKMICDWVLKQQQNYIEKKPRKSKIVEIHEIERYEIPIYEPKSSEKNYVFSSDDLPKKAKRCKLCNK